MSIYAGLDVNDKTTHICTVDAEDSVIRRDVVASDPDVLAKWLERHSPISSRLCWRPGLFRPSSIMDWQNAPCP